VYLKKLIKTNKDGCANNVFNLLYIGILNILIIISAKLFKITQ